MARMNDDPQPRKIPPIVMAKTSCSRCTFEEILRLNPEAVAVEGDPLERSRIQRQPPGKPPCRPRGRPSRESGTAIWLPEGSLVFDKWTLRSVQSWRRIAWFNEIPAKCACKRSRLRGRARQLKEGQAIKDYRVS